MPVQSAVLEDFPKLADSAPILVTDDVVFRWARNARVARLLPVMNDVRVLERKIQANSCKSCQKPVEIDRSAIQSAKAALAECSDEIAKLVKQAVGVLKYKVMYRQHSQPPQEVTR
jgi:hypothetical protein